MVLLFLFFSVFPSSNEQVSYSALYKLAKNTDSNHDAINVLNQALIMAVTQEEIAKTKDYKADRFSKLKMYDSAMINYYAAIELYQKLDNKKKLSNCYHNLAIILKVGGFYSEAVRLLKMSLAYKEKNEFRSNRHGYVIFEIARQYKELGILDSAYYYYNESIDIFKENGNTKYVAASQLDLGLIYAVKLENFKKARKLYNYAIGHYQTDLGKAKCYNNIAATYDSEGKLDTALSIYQKALHLYKKGAASNSRIANCYLNIGRVHGQLNNLDSTKYFFNLATELNASLDKESLIQLAEVYESKNIEKQMQLALLELLKITKEETERNRYIENENKRLQFLMAFQEIKAERERAEHKRKQYIMVTFYSIVITLVIIGSLIYFLVAKKRRQRQNGELINIAKKLSMQVDNARKNLTS